MNRKDKKTETRATLRDTLRKMQARAYDNAASAVNSIMTLDVLDYDENECEEIRDSIARDRQELREFFV